MNSIAFDRIGGRGWQAFASLVGALMLLAGLTFIPTGAVAQTISTTKHNLGSGGPGPNTFGGTSEICVFCHTPHGSDTSAVVPLWNRILNATPSTTYTTYDSLGTSTLDGKTLPVGSVSIACLSCHDGLQAMNAVINSPGSGTTVPMAGTWTAGVGTLSAVASGLAYIGTDLRNDHPVGIQYCGGNLTLATPAAACKDPDFVAAKNADMGASKVWWVGGATRSKTDMILYTRGASAAETFNGGSTTTATGGEPFVECASCHDPHTAANPTFLRKSNANSAVCLSCHVK